MALNQPELTLVGDLRRLVAYHRCIGIQEYPGAAADLLRCQVEVEEVAMVPAQPALKAGVAAGVAVSRFSPSMAQSVSPVGDTLEGVAEEVRCCRSCELHQQRLGAVAGQGEARARLMVVGGWLALPAEMTAANVFGSEEDRMLALMVKAIQLRPEEVFVTNILKCALPETVQPTAVHLQCCLTFLRRQIAAVAPEVICAMGTIPVKGLLNLSQPLSRLRGKFHPYTALDGRQIPVMPTYHPTYLLRVPEMKQKTWEDLQRIQKQLAG